MEIILLNQAAKEFAKSPEKVKQDAFALFKKLSEGMSLSMPISRPLPRIIKGLHELRLSAKEGEFRVFYVLKVKEAIYVLHVLKKKTQTLDSRTIAVLKQRASGVL